MTPPSPIPRTWTLTRRFGEPFNVEGPDNERGPLTVIDAEPIADLLERWMGVAPLGPTCVEIRRDTTRLLHLLRPNGGTDGSHA